MFDDLAIASISTIAASGETEPFKYLLNHPSIGRAVVLGHYDGDEVNKIPVSGCGGLHGKNQQLKTSRTLFPEIEADDLDEFISQIEHTDVFLQTHLIAQKVAQLRKDPLPIIAAVVDHLTYQINPISLTLQENGSLHTVINPELSIPPTRRKNEKVAKFLGRDSAFRESQKRQNPQAVVLSTSPIPIAISGPFWKS